MEEMINAGIYEKCSLCNTPSELVEVISNEQIIRVCNSCAEKNRFPVINRPTQEQLNRAHRFYGVRERLSARKDLQPIKKEKSPEDKALEKYIRENAKKGDYPDLVDNFHWHIQHARRMKKLSQKQLAESIAEPEIMIDLAEQGKLPEDYSKVIIKLEQFLRVPLRKQQEKPPESAEGNEEKPEDFDIKKANFMEVTTGYLKSLKDKWNKWGNKPEEEEEKSEEKKEE